MVENKQNKKMDSFALARISRKNYYQINWSVKCKDIRDDKVYVRRHREDIGH
jgi:hypothetical protein